MRLLKTVLATEGQKRFKLIETDASLSPKKCTKPERFKTPTHKIKHDIRALNLSDMDISAARQAYKKLNNKTQYCIQFGEPPKADDDFLIIK